MTEPKAAFPLSFAGGDYQAGMTLRDWFAGMAFQAAWEARKEGDNHDMAECAYQMADAMLKARMK